MNIYEEYIKNNWNRLFRIDEIPEKISIMKIGGRNENNSSLSLLLYVNDNRMPSYFIKFNRDPGHSEYVEYEHENYVKIFNKLNESRKSVPKPIFIEKINNHTVFCESVLFGNKLGNSFFKRKSMRHKKKVTKKYFRLSSEWLNKFHSETLCGYETIDDGFIRRSVQYPIDNILKKHPDELADLKSKFEGLINTVKKYKGKRIPEVGVQGDFDYFNILLDEESVSVLDWEDCREKGMPFQDIFYFIFHYGCAFYSKGCQEKKEESFERFFEQNSWTLGLSVKFFESFAKQFDLGLDLLFAMAPLTSIELLLKDHSKQRHSSKSYPLNSLVLLRLMLELFDRNS